MNADPCCDLSISISELGGFDDLTGFKAARADADSLSATFDDGAYALKIGIKAAVCAVVGVADFMTELRPFATYLAAFSHCYVPPMRILS